jgi:hypothetical protein
MEPTSNLRYRGRPGHPDTVLEQKFVDGEKFAWQPIKYVPFDAEMRDITELPGVPILGAIMPSLDLAGDFTDKN